MIRLRTTMAFLSGCVVTMAAGVAVSLHAQNPPQDSLTVCLTDQGLVRYAGPAACAVGEKRIVLRPLTKPDEPKPDPPPDAARIGQIERRLEQLEDCGARGELGGKVVAPFEVVDRAGKRIFYVEPGYATFYNGSGKPVARIVSNENGGYFQGTSATGTLSAAIGGSASKIGLLISENDVTRVDLGRNERGNYGLKISGKDGKVTAGIGQSEAGSGVVIVSDQTGTPKARMWVHSESQGGVIDILNASGSIATLAQGRNGGLLQLTNAAGEVMVEAGVTADTNVGLVRTGPAAFNSGIGFLGLPGSYIVGKPGK